MTPVLWTTLGSMSQPATSLSLGVTIQVRSGVPKSWRLSSTSVRNPWSPSALAAASPAQEAPTTITS